MKKYLLLLASALMLLSVAGCGKKEPQPKPEPNPEPPVEKSKECKLLSFSVKGDKIEIKGELYNEDKVVELVYLAEELPLLANVTATATFSEKATIAPDPATVKDFTKDQVFTITAEDGKTTAKWTVKPVLAKMTVEINKVSSKKLSEMGVESFTKFAGNQIAFCAVDKYACANRTVLNLDGTKAGELNVSGMVANPTLVTLGNDNQGRLVATVGFKDKGYTTPCENANGIKSTQIWLWKDGWDKAPVKIYENPADVAMFMNVGGDWDNSMIVTAVSPGRNGNHHIWVFEKGVLNREKWEFFKTGFESESAPNLAALSGAGAGENVCPMDGTKEGTFVWAHALPLITPEQGGWNRCGGSVVATREGTTGTDKHLRGTIWADKLVAKQQHGGIYEFGNIEICANIKGFTFNGEDYVAVTHVGWDKAYTTVINMTKSTDTVSEYLLRTQATPMTICMPAVAYVYDKAKDTGHLLVLYGAGNTETRDMAVTHYDLTRKKI